MSIAIAIRWLKDMAILWRPLRPAVRNCFRDLREFSLVSYVGRAVNGQGRTFWRSFHFAVRETDWVVVLHDQGNGTEPWVLFINQSRNASWNGRYANFEKFLAQLPANLQNGFKGYENLFPPPRVTT